MQIKRWWLGGLATLAAFLLVAPAAFGSGFDPGKFSKPSINIDVQAQIQAQYASQDADVSQSGHAESGDATSQGGIAIGGDGGKGGSSAPALALPTYKLAAPAPTGPQMPAPILGRSVTFPEPFERPG